jgi:hypothetical protein
MASSIVIEHLVAFDDGTGDEQSWLDLVDMEQQENGKVQWTSPWNTAVTSTTPVVPIQVESCPSSSSFSAFKVESCASSAAAAAVAHHEYYESAVTHQEQKRNRDYDSDDNNNAKKKKKSRVAVKMEEEEE